MTEHSTPQSAATAAPAFWKRITRDTETLQKIFIALLLLAIFVGAWARFTQPLSVAPDDDEITNFISATKLNTPHPNYDPRLYNFEHPFLGRWLMGALIDRSKYYQNVRNLPSNVFTYNYLAASELKGQEQNFRFMNALFGLLTLIPIFLLGKWIYGKEAGLLAAALAGVSIAFINLSRVAYQDAYLPFFLIFAIYFALRFIHSSPTETWKKKSIQKIASAHPLAQKFFSKFTPEIALWLGFLLFMALALLVRIGQPIIILLALLVCAFPHKRKIAGILTVIALSGITTFFGYGLRAIQLTYLVYQHGSQFGELSWKFLPALVAQNSFAFLGIIVVLIAYFISQLEHQSVEKNSQRASGNEMQSKKMFQFSNGKELLLLKLLPIILLALIFTNSGVLPRYYAVFMFIPLLWAAGNILPLLQAHWKIILIGGLLLFDIFQLISIAPFTYEYTVMGLSPAFRHDFTGEINQVISTLQQLKVKSYFTTDARLILRDERSFPLPPKGRVYTQSNQCDPAFFARFAQGYTLVYQHQGEITQDEYLCPYVLQYTHQSIAVLPDEEHPNEIIYWMQRPATLNTLIQDANALRDQNTGTSPSSAADGNAMMTDTNAATTALPSDTN